MSREGQREVPEPNLIQQIEHAALGAFVISTFGGLWAYFKSIGRKVDKTELERRFAQLERTTIEPLRHTALKVEGAVGMCVTREELKSSMSDLRNDFLHSNRETKEAINHLTERVDRWLLK